MFVEALFSHLEQAASVQAVCRQVFPQVIPEGRDAPAIVYNVDEDNREPLVDGGISSLRSALVSVDAYSDRLLEAHGIADTVEELLRGHTGALGVSNPVITADNIRLERRLELFERDTKLHRVSMQFSIAYTQGA